MYRLFYLYRICEREREPLELQHTSFYFAQAVTILHTRIYQK